jgi:hypothetical protein
MLNNAIQNFKTSVKFLFLNEASEEERWPIIIIIIITIIIKLSTVEYQKL